jgi:hypothetical protein
MPRINLVAVLGAAVLAFVMGGLWYSPLLFGRAYLTLRGLDPAANVALPIGELVGEFSRWLLITVVLAALMPRIGIDGVGAAVLFGLTMWVIIYAALAGSVLHEAYPWRVYALHAGDGLVKLIMITAILGLWPSGG